MFSEIPIGQILIFVFSVLFSIIAFFLRDQHTRLNKVEDGLQNHRVEDAQSYIKRDEIQSLRDDIRGMLSPLHNKIDDIEKYLREKKNEI